MNMLKSKEATENSVVQKSIWMLSHPDSAVAEAFRVKFGSDAQRGLLRLDRLGPRVMSARGGKGVRWDMQDGVRRLRLQSAVTAIAECGGRVCCGCKDGTVVVWDPRGSKPVHKWVGPGAGGREVAHAVPLTLVCGGHPLWRLVRGSRPTCARAAAHMCTCMSRDETVTS